MRPDNLLELLRSLRQQAIAAGENNLGSHQLDAHWSIAYASQQLPEAWEIYRAPSLHIMPRTDFYVNHANEIQEALKPVLTWELLKKYAVPKLNLDEAMSDSDRKKHGYPGKVQYYDVSFKRWLVVDVPRVRWFDGREIIRESLLETKNELLAKIDKNLQRYKAAADKDPCQKKLDKLAEYEKFIGNLLPDRLKKFDNEKTKARTWLKKLESTPDFAKEIFAITRQAENDVRKATGVPLVGEGWVSETELLYRVRQLLPDIEVIHHGQPKWLGRQHFDIWIPSMSIAIEYHGLQHFRAIDFFGGEDAFKQGQERDNRKRELCHKNSVNLLEISYDQEVDDDTLRALLLASP